MANRTYFARNRITLEAESVNIKVGSIGSQHQALVNGTPILTNSNIPTEMVTLGLNAGNFVPGAETPIIFSGSVTPASTNGITTVAGTSQLQTTRRGLYCFIVRLDCSAETAVRVTYEFPSGTAVQQSNIHAFTVAGQEAYATWHFWVDIGTNTTFIHRFQARGDSYPVAGAPITYANTSSIQVLIFERKL